VEPQLLYYNCQLL